MLDKVCRRAGHVSPISSRPLLLRVGPVQVISARSLCMCWCLGRAGLQHLDQLVMPGSISGGSRSQQALHSIDTARPLSNAHQIGAIHVQDDALPGDIKGPLAQVCAAIEQSVASGLLPAEHAPAPAGPSSGAGVLSHARARITFMRCRVCADVQILQNSTRAYPGKQIETRRCGPAPAQGCCLLCKLWSA